MERIPGGKAPGGSCPQDVDPREIARGVIVEMEHTKDWRIAREIACDHLWEDRHYYAKLATIHVDGVGLGMARRLANQPRYTAAGSCPANCYAISVPPYCQCNDVAFRGLGMSEGTKKWLGVGALMVAAMGGAIAGGAIKRRLVHRRY